MVFENNTSVENQEVAEPETESVENQEVAEPETTAQDPANGKHDADAAFAAMRRDLQAAQKEAADAKKALADKEAKETARRNVYQSLGVGENADVEAIAETLGVDANDILASISAEESAAQKEVEIKNLQEQIVHLTAEKQVNESIKELQKLNPNIKDINDLGEGFVDMVSKGLTIEQAYYAVKGKEISTQAIPPDPIGKVYNEPPKKDFITEAEFDAMTPEQQKANIALARKSMSKW